MDGAGRLMTDELSVPLGRKRKTQRGQKRAGLKAWPWGRIGAGMVLGVALGIGAWIALVDDPQGGRPVAEAPITPDATPNALADTLATERVMRDAPPVQPLSAPGGPSIITLGADTTLETGPDAADEGFGAYAELIEMSEVGPLPRVSSAGLRPYEAYARPAISPQAARGRKLIGVVMTGLGLNESSTRAAIEALPGTVTLAFVPYGNGLESLVEAARAGGHEVMLEIPLEPFDYPQNDPGPHTLLVDQPVRANLDRLYWLLSRMGAYTGVINHMGARFTASAADFSPVMEELGLRGLSYLDDGSSNRSLAEDLARQNGVPYARSDGVLDANPSASAIAAALDGLKAQADAHGQAIGMLSALPVSIRTLAEWAQALDESQYLLVPVSALAGQEAL